MASPEPLINIDDLAYTPQFYQQVESDNNARFNALDFTTAEIKIKCIEWASKQFPSNFHIISLPVKGTKALTTGYYKCSDGTDRALQDYISFFLNKTLQDFLETYQSKITGILLSVFAQTSSDSDELMILISKPDT
jgi:hypothetical protein